MMSRFQLEQVENNDLAFQLNYIAVLRTWCRP